MRFSSQTLRNLGEESRVVSKNGSTVVEVANGRSSNYRESQTDFDFGTKVSGSLNINRYNTLFSYFQKLSGSTAFSNTVTTIILDASMVSGSDPRVVAEMYANGRMTPLIYSGINALRPKSSQEELVRNVNNRSSFVSRNINP